MKTQHKEIITVYSKFNGFTNITCLNLSAFEDKTSRVLIFCTRLSPISTAYYFSGKLADLTTKIIKKISFILLS